MILRPLLPSLALLLAPPAASGGDAPRAPLPEAALSGIAATAAGNLLVSPPPGGNPAVLELSKDGALVKSWAYPDGSPLEVVDSDPSGRPILLDAAEGRVLVLDPSKADPAATINLKSLAIDGRQLAPLVRAAPDGGVLIAAADGTAVVHVSTAGEAKVLPLAGTAAGVGDFDVAEDGRIAILDPQAHALRVWAADGTTPQTIPITGSDPGAYDAVVRFAPGSGELWVLELPAVSDDAKKPPALLRFDPKGKLLARIDHADGAALEPIAGLAPTRDGVWLASLEGEARRIDVKGTVVSRFDAVPPPSGVSWDEKRRLLGVAKSPQTAPLADAVAALGVVHDRAAEEQLWSRVLGEAAAAAPLVVDATAKGTLDGPAMATFFVKSMPATADALHGAFKNKSIAVRGAAIATLRDPSIEGFDAEIAAASADPDPDVRAAAIVVIARARWSAKTAPLVLARLGDADPDLQNLTGQVLLARLPETVDAVCKVVKDPKASEKARIMASRTLLLDVPGGNSVPPLPADKHACLKTLAASADPSIKRVGALALVVHDDPGAPAALEKSWSILTVEQKQIALSAWSGSFGEDGAQALLRLVRKEKNLDLRPALFQALGRQPQNSAKSWLLKIATTPGGDERDRAMAISLSQRKLSDAQIASLSKELPQAGSDLRKAILGVAGARGVAGAAPAIAELAGTSDPSRKDAFTALYEIGSAAGVPVAIKRINDGSGTAEIELTYLAAVGGVPGESKAKLREIASGGTTSAYLAAEALARSGDASGLAPMLDHARADRYGGAPRDPGLAGALAALGPAGRDAAEKLLADPNAATREDGAVALSLIGGDACKPVIAWGTSRGVTGVSVPAAFYALAACGDAKDAAAVYEQVAKTISTGDPVSQTADPRAFAALLAEMLRQPDFRAKADPVLQAVTALPRPAAQSVAQALTTELHPAIAVPAMKYLF